MELADDEAPLQVSLTIKASGRRHLFAFGDLLTQRVAPEITGLEPALVPEI